MKTPEPEGLERSEHLVDAAELVVLLRVGAALLDGADLGHDGVHCLEDGAHLGASMLRASAFTQEMPLCEVITQWW